MLKPHQPIDNIVSNVLDSHKYIVIKKFKLLSKPLLDEAKELTSGNIPRKLSKPKRPWARNNADHREGIINYAGKRQKVRLPNFKGGGMFPLLPINKQTGDLQESLDTRDYTVGNITYLELFSGTPYGKYILSKHGTKKMIPRNFQQRINNRMRRYKINE